MDEIIKATVNGIDYSVGEKGIIGISLYCPSANEGQNGNGYIVNVFKESGIYLQFVNMPVILEHAKKSVLV